MIFDNFNLFGEALSPFRTIVFIFSSFSIFYLVRRRLNKEIQFGDFVFWATLTCVFITLSIYPALLGDISYYAGLSGKGRYDRLILLSFIAIILLFIQIYRLQTSIRLIKLQTADSLQALYAKEFLTRSEMVPGSEDLLLLIPAYNEEKSIKHVIERVPKAISDIRVNTIVISDGSTDKTVQEALDCGAHVVELPFNSGQAFAYRTGYKIAILGEFKYVLHLDADGQYKPEELHLLLAPLVNDESDLVSGSRLLGEYEEKFQPNNIIRSLGVYCFNFILSIITGCRVTDSASGFRGVTVSILSKLNLEQTQFHSSELLIEAVKKGARFTEVGVSFKRRMAGTSKKPAELFFAIGFIKAIIKSWFKN